MKDLEAFTALVRVYRDLHMAAKTTGNFFGNDNIFQLSEERLVCAIGNLAYCNEEVDVETITRLLIDGGTANEVANVLLRMRLLWMASSDKEEVRQPAPVFFTQEQIDTMQHVFGSYKYKGESK